MSWLSQKREYSFRFVMVDWKGSELGELTGFIDGNSTHEYNSDLRAIATLRTRNDDGYIPNSMIRVDVSSGDGDTFSIGTFCVKNISATMQEQLWIKSYELVSPIYKMQYDLLGTNYVINGSRKFGDLLSYFSPEENFCEIYAEESVRNLVHVFSDEGVVYEAGTSAYEAFSDLCSIYNIRMGVKDHAVLFEQYIAPSHKPVEFEFSQANGTIATDREIAIETTQFETPNDVVAVYNNNNVTLFGRATMPISSPIAPSKRQMYYGHKFDVRDMQPETQERINEFAQQELDRVANHNKLFKFSGLFIGQKAGTVGMFGYQDFYGNQIREKAQIQSMHIEWDESMLTDYELKEVNYDE